MQIQNLKHKYDNKTVLDIPFLDFPKNSIFGLTGPNGAGKTTIISLISNILTIQSGSILNKNNCGLLLQNTLLYGEMTGLQNLRYFCQVNRIDKSRISYVLGIVQIDAQTASQKFKNLSQGNKQRLLIARAFLTDSDIILLDEPFNAVDVPTMRLMKDAIIDFSRETKKTIIISSHHLKEIEDLITHGAIINRGRLIYTFNNNEIRKSSSVFSVFYENDIKKVREFSQSINLTFTDNNNILQFYGLTEEQKWNIIEVCKAENTSILKIEFQVSLEDLFISKIKENDLLIYK